MFRYSGKSIKKLEGVHPTLVAFAKELISISPYDFRINEGVRTVATQQEYYSWGRTKFVTPWGAKIYSPVTKLDGVKMKSKHQIQSDGYSHAFDIAFLGKNLEEVYSQEKFDELLKVARPLMKKYNVFWGGDWKRFQDKPHWQLIS